MNYLSSIKWDCILVLYLMPILFFIEFDYYMLQILFVCKYTALFFLVKIKCESIKWIIFNTKNIDLPLPSITLNSVLVIIV
jgi:hypothetical protein